MTQPGVSVHPQALCESETVGAGTRVWAFAHVLRGAVIGPDCNICDHVYIEGGAQLGRNVTVKNGVSVWDKVLLEDDVFVGPNAAFTNDLRPRAAIKRDPSTFLATSVRRGATIGANATIVCGVEIGEHGFVAAGAVVTRDVAPHALVAGTPAARVGWACTCGMTLEPNLACPDCGRTFRFVDECDEAKGLEATS